MGKKSVERIICKIYLNVSKPFVNRTLNAINKTNFKFKIQQQTFGYVKFIKKVLNKNTKFSSTMIELSLVLDVDMYHIVRIKKGKVIANIAKMFKKKRKDQVCSEIKQEIEQNIKEEIDKQTGILCFARDLAITIENVIVK